MINHRFDSLVEAIDTLSKEGFTEDFEALENAIKGLYCKRIFLPDQLRIVESFRFDELTDPGDETMLFSIKADDGTRGTLLMSYSADHNHNVELIKKIPYA